MIFYNHENALSLDLLCRICHKICLNPTSCPQCRSLYCLYCLKNYFSYYCQSCIFHESDQILLDKIYQLDAFSNKLIDHIKCLCYYCNTYILYKKYRNHQCKCRLIKTYFQGYEFPITIYNSNNEALFLDKQICNGCKNIVFRPNCQECKVFLKSYEDEHIRKNENQIQINQNLEVLESEFNLKFSCKRCKIFVKYADLSNHKIKCKNTWYQGDKKQVILLKQNIEKYDQTLCYINTNNYQLYQNYRELTLKYQKYQKVIEQIEKEQTIDQT